MNSKSILSGPNIAYSFADDKSHRSSFGVGMLGSGGSVFARNSRTSANPGFLRAGNSNQRNCILSLSIPSATKIVDSGLAEIFVTVKGTVIVLGTYFIQTSEITLASILGGIFVGVLSSLVLFITSFPDYDADKSKGRKTLVIVLGKQKATLIFWVFPIVAYLILFSGVILEIFPIYSLISLAAIPLIIKSGIILKQNFDKIQELVPAMANTITFSRVTGALFVIGFILTL